MRNSINSAAKRVENSIKNLAINKIGYLSESSVYGCDLHHEIYNTDYFIIGRYQAKEWLKKNTDIFEVIEIVMDYEKDNFGEVSTEIHEPEKLVNMYVYILGEKLLNESETLRENWDNRLSKKDLNKIAKEIKKATIID